MSRILKLSTLRPDEALENLNRLTGLDFQHWPESLLEGPVSSAPALEAASNSDGECREQPMAGQG